MTRLFCGSRIERLVARATRDGDRPEVKSWSAVDMGDGCAVIAAVLFYPEAAVLRAVAYDSAIGEDDTLIWVGERPADSEDVFQLARGAFRVAEELIADGHVAARLLAAAIGEGFARP